MFSNQFQPLVLIAVLLGSIPWSCGHETSGEHLCPVALYCPADHECEHGRAATGQKLCLLAKLDHTESGE